MANSAGADAIISAFRPQVAVFQTEEVSRLCRKNNVDNLADLLLPFSALGVQVTLRDPTNQSISHTLDNFGVELRDIRAHAFVPAGAPLDSVCAEAVRCVQVNLAALQQSGQHVPVTPAPSEPDWYEVFRSAVLRWAEPAEHEFVRHFVAALLAVSTEGTEPLEQLERLSHAQNELQHGSPNETSHFAAGPYRSDSKWMLANTLKYYVLVHDVVSGDAAKAKSLYESVQNKYGESNCCLLCINSAHDDGPHTQPLPDLWSPLLLQRYSGLELGLSRAAAAGHSESETAKMLTTSAESASAYFQIGDERDRETTAARDEALVNGLIANVQGDHTDGAVGAQAPNGTVQPEIEPAQRRFRQESIPHALSSDDLASSVGTNGMNSLDAPVFLSASINNEHSAPVKTETKGACLLAEDRDRLGACVADFLVKALVPFIEKQMKLLNEQVISRKGLHKSFISGARKWLAGSSSALPPMSGSGGGSSGAGGNTSASNVSLAGLAGGYDERSHSPAPPAAPAPAAASNTTALSYGRDSGELQIRRFADLAFVCRQYYLAYQTYQTLRRDFHADQAWLYYAGALEMSALCAYLISQLQAGSKPYSHSNMDTAIATYLNTCNRQTLALRATLLGSSILQSLRMHSDCAQSLIRLSGHDSDLCAGVMLEQAARCLHRANGKRKAALHLVLAGHRYSKAGHGPLALRCYAAARSQYADTRLRFAVDHVNYTIGRHALALLPDATAAVGALAQLFDGPTSSVASQSAAQHALFVADYVAACNKLAMESGALPELKVPYFDMNSVNVFLGGSMRDWDALRALDEESDSGSHQLRESLSRAELCCVRASGSADGKVPFRPTVAVCNQNSDNSKPAFAPIGEPLCVRVAVRNRLSAAVSLSDVALCVVSADGRRVPVIGAPRVPSDDLLLRPMDAAEIYCAVLPDQSFAGQSLTICAIEYTLSLEQDSLRSEPRCSVRGQCTLRTRGRRLNATKQHMLTAMYAKDLRLHPTVSSGALPQAELSLASDWPSTERDCLCGELVPCQLRLQNVAQATQICAVALAALPAAACAVADAQHVVTGDSEMSWRILGAGSGPLEPSCSIERTVHLKAPSVPGRHVIRILVYYEITRPDGSTCRRCGVRGLVLYTSGALRLSARLLPRQPQSQSAGVLCVSAANSCAADESEAQRRLAEFRLDRVSLIVPAKVPARCRWRVEHVAMLGTELKLGYGEVQNVCVHLSDSAEPGVSSADICPTAALRENLKRQHFQLLTLLPWRPSALLAASDQIFCALFWSAQFEDGTWCPGETWAPLGQLDANVKVTGAEPATVALLPYYGGTDARSVMATMAADVDLLAAATALIRCCIVSPPKVVHDFGTNRLCTIKVTLRVEWVAPPVKRPVGDDTEEQLDPLSALLESVVLCVAPAAGKSETAPGSLHWRQLAVKRVRLGRPPIAPEYLCTSLDIPLEATVSLPGVYSLSGLQLRTTLDSITEPQPAQMRIVNCDPFVITVVNRKL